jgi:hypothetical protein
MLLALGHISKFEIRHSCWFSVFDIFRISFHIGYASNMNTFDFLRVSDYGISHLAWLTSWNSLRSLVKNMMMIMMIIIIIIKNHWFSFMNGGKTLSKSTWCSCLCGSSVYCFLQFNFLSKLPISLKFWTNWIIVADDVCCLFFRNFCWQPDIPADVGDAKDISEMRFADKPLRNMHRFLRYYVCWI